MGTADLDETFMPSEMVATSPITTSPQQSTLAPAIAVPEGLYYKMNFYQLACLPSQPLLYIVDICDNDIYPNDILVMPVTPRALPY